MSPPITFAGLPEGEHVLKVEHPHGSSQSSKVKVARGEVSRQTVKLWVIDTKAVLTDGSVKYGMLVERNAYGDIVLAESAKKLERYLKPQLASVVSLTPEQAQTVMEEMRGGAKGGKPGQAEEVAAAGAGNEETRAGARRPAAARADEPEEAAPARPAAPRPRKPEAPEGGGAAPAAEEQPEVRIDAKELTETFKHASSTELTQRYQNRKMIITGVPTASGRDALGGYVSLGHKIRCFLTQEAFTNLKDKLKTAQEEEAPVTVTGIGTGVRAGMLVVRECEVTIPEEKDKPKGPAR
jgi:hypothetical protein